MARHHQAQPPQAVQAATELEPLLTVSDVQRILQVSKPKVYQLIHSGLPSLKIDKGRRFERASLQAWIAQRREGL